MRRRLPVPPRKARFDEFMVEAHAARQNHLAHGPPTLIQAVCFHGHLLADHPLICELLGVAPIRLPPLRTINPIQSNPFGQTFMNHLESVPLYDSHNLSRKLSGHRRWVHGLCWTLLKSCKHVRLGSKWLTRKQPLGTAMTALFAVGAAAVAITAATV